MAPADDRPHPSRSRSAVRHGRAHGRGGFTLVEMLVVLAIGLALLALATGGFYAFKDANRLLAAEQVVADLVRQARHAARSTGAPVTLRITQVIKTINGRQVAVGGRVAGVSRTCIWSQSFDELANFPERPVGSPDGRLHSLGFTPDGSGAYSDPDATTGLTIGRSGKGVWPAKVPYDAADPALDLRPALLERQLPRRNQLVHGSGATAQSDGFYLACCVRPPAAATIPMTATLAPPYVIPLAVIGGTDADATTCIAGLMLERGEKVLATPGGPVTLPTWVAVGWINQQGSPATVQTSVRSLDPTATDIAGPIGGDRWEDIGLLYDGTNLELYRNGHLVGTAAPGSAPLLAPDSESVFIGQVVRTSGNPPEMADAPLDDVQLYRLGTDQGSDLPGNVVPETPGTLTLRPDGSLDLPVFYPAGPSQAVATPAKPAARDPTGTAPGAVTVGVPGGTTEKVVPTDATRSFVFVRRTQGARDQGPLNAAVIAIDATGVRSGLATIEKDPATGTVYAITDPQP